MTNINVLYNAKHFFIEHFSFSTCFRYIVQLMFTIFQCLLFYPLNWRLWEWFQELCTERFSIIGLEYTSLFGQSLYFFVKYFLIMTTKLYTFVPGNTVQMLGHRTPCLNQILITQTSISCPFIYLFFKKRCYNVHSDVIIAE